MTRTATILLLLFLPLCGCRIQKEDASSTTTVNDDNATTRDVEHLEKTIETSNNTTQNALSGLVNASVSKLSDRITGVDAKIEKVIGANVEIGKSAEKIVGLETSMKDLVNANLTMQNDLKAQLKVTAEMQTKIDAQAQILADLRINLRSDMDAQIGGKIDKSTQQIISDNKAGRDVINNMLPKEAVDLMIDQTKTNAWILIAAIAALCFITTTLASIWARNSRKRAEDRAAAEREERKKLHELLIGSRAVGGGEKNG